MGFQSDTIFQLNDGLLMVPKLREETPKGDASSGIFGIAFNGLSVGLDCLRMEVELFLTASQPMVTIDPCRRQLRNPLKTFQG